MPFVLQYKTRRTNIERWFFIGWSAICRFTSINETESDRSRFDDIFYCYSYILGRIGFLYSCRSLVGWICTAWTRRFSRFNFENNWIFRWTIYFTSYWGKIFFRQSLKQIFFYWTCRVNKFLPPFSDKRSVGVRE